MLSKIDRSINLDKKGKGRATNDEPTSLDNCPPDGVSDLAPAPIPEGVLPTAEFIVDQKSTPKYAFGLPDGVQIEDCAIFYLGGESLGLNNILMTNGKCIVRFLAFSKVHILTILSQVWSYDVISRTARLESSKTNRMLMRRYAIVERAKDADVIGILVGTLGVGESTSSSPTVSSLIATDTAAYLPLITHMRKLIASHHKKSYTVAVGKLNPAKLANFMEVECFVLIACPENTLIDSKVRRTILLVCATDECNRNSCDRSSLHSSWNSRLHRKHGREITSSISRRCSRLRLSDKITSILMRTSGTRRVLSSRV